MASIYILGDSHMQALGPRIAAGLPEHSVRFQAFPGHSTERAHADASIPSGQDTVVLALGGNDFGPQSAARLALVDAVRLRNPRANIIWFGPFGARRDDVDRRHAGQTADQASQLPGLGVRFVDTRPFSTADHRRDQVHFTGAGYARIADAMTASIAAAGARRPERLARGGGGAAVVALAAGAALAVALLVGRR